MAWLFQCSPKIFGLNKQKQMTSLSEGLNKPSLAFLLLNTMGRDDKTGARLTGSVFSQLTALMQDFKLLHRYF